MMIDSEIKERLSAILVDKFEIHKASLDFSEPQTMTSFKIDLDALQMYEFLMCIENEFDIYFQPQDFQTLSFRNLHDVEVAIMAKLSGDSKSEQ